MSKGKRDVTNLHYKLEAQRHEVRRIRSAAVRALRWWERNADRADKLFLDFSHDSTHITNHELHFFEWLGYCPWAWVRWIGRLITPAPILYSNFKSREREYQIWKTHRLMGGDRKLSGDELCERLGIDKTTMGGILSSIAAEERRRDAELAKHKFIYKALDGMHYRTFFVRENGDRGEAKVYRWSRDDQERFTWVQYPWQTLPLAVADEVKPVIYFVPLTFDELEAANKRKDPEFVSALEQHETETQHATPEEKEHADETTLDEMPNTKS